MTPYRSREYLDLSYVEGKTCIRCERVGCEPAHYSGQFADQLGKGGVQKSFDLACADLCRQCHEYFDLYKGGNDDARAVDFMLCVLRTLHRNLQLGYVELVVHEHPVQREHKRERVAGRRRASHCTRPDKIIPRTGLV